jgi:hypothetical protein
MRSGSRQRALMDEYLSRKAPGPGKAMCPSCKRWLDMPADATGRDPVTCPNCRATRPTWAYPTPDRGLDRDDDGTSLPILRSDPLAESE